LFSGPALDLGPETVRDVGPIERLTDPFEGDTRSGSTGKIAWMASLRNRRDRKKARRNQRIKPERRVSAGMS